jgi:hypothetical protein
MTDFKKIGRWTKGAVPQVHARSLDANLRGEKHARSTSPPLPFDTLCSLGQALA